MSNAACLTEFGVISPTLHISSMVAMLWLIYQYAKSMKSEQNQTLKNLGLTLFSMQMMYCMVRGSCGFLWAFTSDCSLGSQKENYDVAILSYVSTILYFAQYNVMIFLLFYRLKVVFDGTAYRLSQFTKWAFYIMYILSSILAVSVQVVNILMGGHSPVRTILTSFSGLCGISMIFFLTFLFVTKLITVNNNCDGAQQKAENKLLSTITKQSILALISIASLLVSVIIFFLVSSTRLPASSIHAHFVSKLCLLIDIWTNFICILLSYQSFNTYYAKMCGCCDTKCKELCGKLVKPQKYEVPNVDPISTRTVQTTTVMLD